MPGSSVGADAARVPDRHVAGGLSAGSAAFFIGLLLSVQALGTDIVLPSFPAIGRAFGVQSAEVQATLSAMIAAFGLSQLAWGPLSDRFGRRPVLLCGMAVFAAAGFGAASADSIGALQAWRALQGAGMASAVVCARAIVRDAFEPTQGARVTARALSGLGVVAVLAPLAGGALMAAFGWRSPLLLLGVAGLAAMVLLAWRLPETAPRRQADALRIGPLARQMRQVLVHPVWQAWAGLLASTYGTLFVYLAGGSYVLIGVLGLSPTACGLMLAASGGVYVIGTFACRRLLARHGLRGAVQRGAGVTLCGALAMGSIALLDWRSLPALLVAQSLFAFGHGIHQPCAQAAALGPFAYAAGTAAALAGCLLAATAFGVGYLLGWAGSGSMRPLAGAMAIGCLLTCTMAWGLVRRRAG